MTALPGGFRSHVANLGVKDDHDDFVVIAADRPVPAAGVFTRSRFAAPCVVSSRANLADSTAQVVVVVARNANVANGRDGDADNRALEDAVATRLGCAATDVLIASTGVIGRRYPIERMLEGIAAMPARVAGHRHRPSGRGDHDDRHPSEARRAHRRRKQRPNRRRWPRARG